MSQIVLTHITYMLNSSLIPILSDLVYSISFLYFYLFYLN